MGHLLCYQPSLQNVLQTELGELVEEHFEGIVCG